MGRIIVRWGLLGVVTSPVLRRKSRGRLDRPRLIPRLRIRGVLHVADGDLAPDPGTLHLGEVDAQLLGLALGRLRGVGPFLPSRVLGLLGGLTRCILRLVSSLSGLIGGLPCCVLRLLGGSSGGVLSLLGCALGGILCSLRCLAGLVGNLARGILGLSGGLTGGVLDALHGLTGLVCHLVQGSLIFLAFLLLRT